MSKGIAVLGSTGTIGANTLAIIEAFPDKFHVVSLSAGQNVDKLREQIERFHPRIVSVSDFAACGAIASEFPEVRVLSGDDGLEACVTAKEVDVVVMGIVGFAAMAPTLKAIRARKAVALANKESLVVAGPLLKKEIAASGASVIPVDSEHNALFQLLQGRRREEIATLVLTASGGPLLRRPDLPLDDVTPAIATAHPNWKMGPKISVDSATLMNKGLELIEASFLFDMPQSRIEVWVHPQSIVHGAVWLTDNSCLAQLSKPDMKSSIGFAMGYPERLASVIPKLTIKDMASLEFLEPDTKRFPALDLARRALESGASHLVALNAGNEIAVESFLRGRLLFSQIAPALAEILAGHRAVPVDGLDAVFAVDAEARRAAEKIVESFRK